MAQMAEAKRKNRPQKRRRRGFDAARLVIPMNAMAQRSTSCPTTHHPPRWTKPLLMTAGENLYDGATTGMAIAFDDVALNLARDQEFQSCEFFTKIG